MRPLFTKNFSIALANSTTSIAFLYSEPDRSRRHGPGDYEDIQSFRPWLRDEFSFRCVYCLKRETWESPIGGFDIDHVVPRSSDETRALHYSNLVYSCHGCNLRRGKHPIPDPETHLTSLSAYVGLDGLVTGLTPEARDIIDRLLLNSSAMVEYRRQWTRIVGLAIEHDETLLFRVMGYPTDIPNLELLQPPSNERPDGIGQSIHARRQRGDLPSEIYLH